MKIHHIKRLIRGKIIKNALVQKILLKKRLADRYTQFKIICGKTKAIQIERMCKSVDIMISPGKKFQHWIDTKIILFNGENLIGNVPPNYELVLNNSLEDLKKESKLCREQYKVIVAIEAYIDRIIEYIKRQELNDNMIQTLSYYERIKTDKAETLEEALQRILFWSSLFWQTGHKLIGLGRLDKILDEFVNEGQSDEEITHCIIEFYKELHQYYEYKSMSLLGDTGQIIILSGKEETGKCFTNRLTYLFIEALKKIKISDPKILLRVCNDSPDDLLKCAVECISTGIGSPLLSNDEVVIPSILQFGYDYKDAYNYVTSACWEPVSYGNSLEQNNLFNVNLAKVFVSTLHNPELCNIKSYSEFIELYKRELQKYLKAVLRHLSELRWEEDPLFSIFTQECNQNKKDISQGGAKYNNYGILTVGLANAVDSITIVRKAVFDDSVLDLNEIHLAWTKGPKEREEIKEKLSECEIKFGQDDPTILGLINEILECIENVLKDYRNPYGGKVKIGLSSPAYLLEGNRTEATLDKRKDNEPLSVHISTTTAVAYTELISFASQIKYAGFLSNGNVVDFFVSPDFLNNNLDKFIQFIKGSITMGFFQMQMNVVSSEILLDAKRNPEKYLQLIVRVWGFSAYFNDLPEEYKDVLIMRALASEGKEY